MKADPEIIEFFKKGRVVVLSTCNNNLPASCPLVYHYIEKHGLLLFKSNQNTLHVRNLLLHPLVAGAVIAASAKITDLSGIQFEGHLCEYTGGWEAYHRKYPAAIFFPGTVYAIRLSHVKLMFNTAGKIRKLYWNPSGRHEDSITSTEY